MRNILGHLQHEEKLKLFRALIERSNDGIYVLELATGRFLDANASACRDLGYTRDELLTLTVFDVTVEVDPAQFETTNAEIKKAGHVRMEILHRRKDGTIYPVEVSLSSVTFGLDYLLAIVRDITERKQLEAELNHERHLWQELLDNSPDRIYFKNTQSRFIKCNQATTRFIGVESPEAMVGKTDFDFYTDAHARPAFEDEQEIIRTGQPMIAKEEREVWKDGQVSWASSTKLPLRDTSGKIIGIMGISRDITGQKQTETSHARLAMAVEQAAETIVITDTDGRILYANPAFEKTSGYTRAEVLGQNPRVLKSGKQDAAFYRRMWDVLGCGEVWQGHFINKRKDGKLYEEEATISPIRDAEGKVINYVAVKRDVTREVQLESQLRHAQKMDAIGTLAGGVAHDFNNILAVIQMQADLLKSDGGLSARQAELADDIVVAVQRAAGLTRQLLMFSRKEVLQPRDLDLNQNVTEMTKMLRRTLGENITVQLKLAEKPMLLHADPGMMDQVLMNLAVNARDAMLNGGQLVIETAGVEFDAFAATQTAQARPGSFVCLSVSDTGCGIPPELLSKIFEPFFTTKGVGKGTGLGLATVFGIAQQHHGWVNVYSEVGHGTTFKIYLPRLSEKHDTKFIEKLPPIAPPGHETILLVEDEPALRTMMNLSLSRMGYRVLEASTGVTALEVWKKHRGEIHLLLTDLMMPDGMTGKELGQRLLKKNPKLKVIYMSGYSPEIVAKNFPLQEGVNFISKPFAVHKLAQILHSNLDNAVPGTETENHPASP